MKQLFIALILLCVSASAGEEAKPLPPLPWHVVNLWWTFEKPEEDFQNLQVDVSINRDVDSSKVNLYIAPVGLGDLNGVNFYGGLQSNSGGWPATNTTVRERMDIGKGAIFSRWAKGALSLDNARAAADGVYESAGYEGDFVSVRRPYLWKAGTYTYELQKLDYEATKDGGFTWVGCFVTDKQTSQRTFIGALRFPGSRLKLWNRNSAFVELYGTRQIRGYTITELPELEIRFSHPRINGQQAKVVKLLVRYPAKKEGAKVPFGPPLMDTSLSSDGSEVICTLHNKLVERQVESFELKLPPAKGSRGTP